VSDDYELAAALVRDAGRLAARMLGAGVSVSRKSSISDVVSAADHAAEALVSERLAEQRPDDGIVGEEGAARPGNRTWYVDPVDGTYNFLSGLPIWSSAVALVDEDGPVLGAIYDAAAEEVWIGGRDRRTARNGVPIAPLVDRPLSELSIATYLHPTTLPDETLRLPLLRAMQGAATVRMLGSGSVELAAVAAGRLGVWLQANSLPWDWLPGSTIVRAAGGQATVIEHAGHRWHIAGAETAVADVVTALRRAAT